MDTEFTTDTLYQGALRLEQPAKGYRFGTDAMLLAAAVPLADGLQVLELGCGVGAALLGIGWRARQAGFTIGLTGIELQDVLAGRAEVNSAANDIPATIVRGDVTDKNMFHQLGRFDRVFCNPPFHPAESSSPAGNAIKTTAHIEETDGLDLWLQSANRFLKPKGVFTMIHRADRLDAILPLCTGFLGAIEIIPFWPKAGQPARRLIIRGQKGSRKPLTLHSGLVMHDTDGAYTPEAFAVICAGIGGV